MGSERTPSLRECELVVYEGEGEEETDWPNRRPKAAYWLGMREIVDILGGRPRYSLPEPDLTGIKAKDVKRGIESGHAN